MSPEQPWLVCLRPGRAENELGLPEGTLTEQDTIVASIEPEHVENPPIPATASHGNEYQRRGVAGSDRRTAQGHPVHRSTLGSEFMTCSFGEHVVSGPPPSDDTTAATAGEPSTKAAARC